MHLSLSAMMDVCSFIFSVRNLNRHVMFSVVKNNVFGVVHISGLTGSMLSLKY